MSPMPSPASTVMVRVPDDTLSNWAVSKGPGVAPFDQPEGEASHEPESLEPPPRPCHETLPPLAPRLATQRTRTANKYAANFNKFFMERLSD